MSGTYEDHLAALRREIETQGARPAVIDAAVSEILADGDQRTAGDLLSLLSDSARYDEGMFTLIHAAESFDDSVYVRALLSVFPRLMASAPRWASIMLMRVLNSSSAQVEMLGQLRDAPDSIKESVREMCQRINDKMGSDTISVGLIQKLTPTPRA